MMNPENGISYTPPQDNQPVGPSKRRSTTLKALAALLLLICIIGGGFLLFQGIRPSLPASIAGNTSSALPQGWCAAPSALSTNFSGTSLSGLAENDVWSVNTQVMHWNGNSWSLAFSPTSPQIVFRSIAEITPNDVWVVGEHLSNGLPSQSVTVHWDGTRWQTISSPNEVANGKNSLVAISASSANDIWAVGFYVPTQGPIGPLIEHWNGTSWTVMSHITTLANAQFTSVKALSSTDAWAVGYASVAHAGQHVLQPITEHWNGKQWRAVSTPNLTISGGGSFYNIGGSTTNDLWAVGSYDSGMLTEHWNGKIWSLVANGTVSPSSSNWLANVAASAPNNAWAVGRVGSTGAGFQPFIEHWNGHQWQTVQDPSADAGELDVITVVGHQFWIVGLPKTAGGHAFIETLCS